MWYNQSKNTMNHIDQDTQEFLRWQDEQEEEKTFCGYCLDDKNEATTIVNDDEPCCEACKKEMQECESEDAIAEKQEYIEDLIAEAEFRLGR